MKPPFIVNLLITKIPIRGMVQGNYNFFLFQLQDSFFYEGIIAGKNFDFFLRIYYENI